MKNVHKYRIFVLGFFVLCCSTMAVVNAQPQQEMLSTSPMLQQCDESYATRNADAMMTTGSVYSANVEEPSSSTPATNGPRRVNGHPDIPMPDPLGDALLPLALLALAYFGYRLIRRRRRA